tara:strand:+ start:70 stop:600 length:531 start_codon:yes stop_codon:yes gene_type:complete
MNRYLNKLLIFIALLFGIYYVLTIKLNNSGEFVNYYYYPSSSIQESVSNKNFIKELPVDSITIVGNKSFDDFVKSDLLFWIDKFKVSKSYGLLNLFPHNYDDNQKKILRVSYKELSSSCFINYDDSIWIEYDGNQTESIDLTTGKGYVNKSIAVLKFFNDEVKSEYIGKVTIVIKN